MLVKFVLVLLVLLILVEFNRNITSLLIIPLDKKEVPAEANKLKEI